MSPELAQAFAAQDRALLAARAILDAQTIGHAIANGRWAEVEHLAHRLLALVEGVKRDE